MNLFVLSLHTEQRAREAKKALVIHDFPSAEKQKEITVGIIMQILHRWRSEPHSKFRKYVNPNVSFSSVALVPLRNSNHKNNHSKRSRYHSKCN